MSAGESIAALAGSLGFVYGFYGLLFGAPYYRTEALVLVGVSSLVLVVCIVIVLINRRTNVA